MVSPNGTLAGGALQLKVDPKIAPLCCAICPDDDTTIDALQTRPRGKPRLRSNTPHRRRFPFVPPCRAHFSPERRFYLPHTPFAAVSTGPVSLTCAFFPLFPATDRFLHQFTERVDLNTRAYFAWVYAARWLGFRMDMVVIMVLIAACFFSVAVNEYSDSVGEGLSRRFLPAVGRLVGDG